MGDSETPFDDIINFMDEFDFDRTYQLVYGPYGDVLDFLKQSLYEHDPRLRYGDDPPYKFTDLSCYELDWVRRHPGAYVNGEWWGWGKIVGFVIARDRKCVVCGNDDIEGLEGGHIISRMYDGSDHPNNIVAMCCICNRLLNPEHETAESFWNWVATKPYDNFYREFTNELIQRVGLQRLIKVLGHPMSDEQIKELLEINDQKAP